MNIRAAIAFAVLAGFLAAPAQATPFTFEFTPPGWTQNNDSAAYGTGVVFSVTVNNGAATDINQSYTFGDITQISVTAIGGSLKGVFLKQSPPYLAEPTLDPLTTNSSGRATLDLLSVSSPDLGGFDQLSMGTKYDFQLGVLTGGGGDTTLAVYGYHGGTLAATNGTPVCGKNHSNCVLPGISLNSVPEPTTTLLFGLALTGLLLAQRRRACKG